jgi:hypothetical protein
MRENVKKIGAGKKGNIWKGLLAVIAISGITSGYFTSKVFATIDEWGTVSDLSRTAANALDLKGLQSNTTILGILWLSIAVTPTEVGNVLAYQTDTNQWQLLESGLSGTNMKKFAVKSLVTINTWPKVIQQIYDQKLSERQAILLTDALNLIGEQPDDFNPTADNLIELGTFLKVLEYWQGEVIGISGNSCLSLDTRDHENNSYIGSQIGAQEAKNFIKNMNKAKREASWGKAVLKLMTVLNKGSLSANEVTAAAEMISGLIPGLGNNESIGTAIKWLRHSLHTEVQLLVLIGKGVVRLARNSLVLSLKEPCKSCVQSPILSKLKEYDCNFVSANRDASNPNISIVNIGLKKYNLRPTIKNSVYVSITNEP